MTERPKPLVPANLDLRKWQYMKLDVVKLQNSDTWALADGWAAKACINLWCRAWHQVPAGSLPNDDLLLAKLADVPDWPSVRNVALRGFVECSDGRLYHPIVCKAALSSAKVAKQKKTAANSRWKKQKLNNADAHAPAVRLHSVRNADAMLGKGKGKEIDSSFPTGKAPAGAEPELFAKQQAPPSAPPPPTDLPTPEAELYRRGREVLGKNAGGLITDLKKHHGGNVALARATIEQASTKSDPRDYVGAVIRGRRVRGELWDTGI
jgi:hypothetical protein